MRERIEPGAIIDGYRVGACIHGGGTGSIYEVAAPAGRDPGFPIAMKAPLLGRGESSVGIDSFEMEQMILPTLTGPHVPRYVASGDVTATPYIVMERIQGLGLSEFVARAPLDPDEVVSVGAALADAVHSVHRQDVVHLDLKPENFMIRPGGEAVVLDFGFARHARYPDLLAEVEEFAAGSAAYVSPEQLRNDRSDLRSDLFALGVLIYELATGRLPFGLPQTLSGMRDRLWRAPAPPRAFNDRIPGWLQEIILRCLDPDPAQRYQSAAHIALDLRNPEQVTLSARAERSRADGFARHLANWWRARSWVAANDTRSQAGGPTVILVAVDTEHPDDERHSPLRFATAQIASLDPDSRVMFVSVIRSPPIGEGPNEMDTTAGRHLEHKARLRHWVAPLKLPASRISLHVVEATSAADTLLNLARANHVDLIVLGAPGPSEKRLGWWRSAASSVTANAPCSVHVVRVPERITSAARPSQGPADDPV